MQVAVRLFQSFVERFRNGSSEPRLRVMNVAAHDKQVHDRHDLRLAIVLLLNLLEVWEEMGDIVGGLQRGRCGARRSTCNQKVRWDAV